MNGTAEISLIAMLLIVAVPHPAWRHTGLTGGWLVASAAGKLAGVCLAGRMLRWKPGEASIIGLAVSNQRLPRLSAAKVTQA